MLQQQTFYKTNQGTVFLRSNLAAINWYLFFPSNAKIKITKMERILATTWYPPSLKILLCFIYIELCYEQLYLLYLRYSCYPPISRKWRPAFTLYSAAFIVIHSNCWNHTKLLIQGFSDADFDIIFVCKTVNRRGNVAIHKIYFLESKNRRGNVVNRRVQKLNFRKKILGEFFEVHLATSRGEKYGIVLFV